MPVAAQISDWPHVLAAGVLVLVRVSGLMVFAPLFSSAAIAARIKCGFAISITALIAPAVSALPQSRADLGMAAILGELAVGLTFGLTLAVLTESLLFAGQLVGMEFSFSLVNLLDPNSQIETPLLGQLFNLLGILVLIGAGLDRSLLAAVMRSFAVVPVGQATMKAGACATLAEMAGAILLAGLQLAAPVLAAAMTVEVVVALVGRISPQLPAMVVGIPLKTLVSYGVLVGSLALWPAWIEGHFTSLLDRAQRLVAP